MKKLFALAALLALCASLAAAPALAGQAQTILAIEGMTCAS